MSHNFGYDLPKKMHPEFSKLVQKKCEELGREFIPKELLKYSAKTILKFIRNTLLQSVKFTKKAKTVKIMCTSRAR